MPYADPEKRREVKRRSEAKRRAEKKAAGVREGNPDVRARAWTFFAPDCIGRFLPLTFVR